jgi:WD40 repeat protein
LYQHNGVVKAVSVSEDGTTILSGSEDKTARIWDIRAAVAVGPPLQHPDRVSKVALTPNGRFAVTICDNGTAYVWDVSSCKRLTQPMQYEVAVDDCKIGPDSSTILIRGTDGTARLYNIPRQLPDNPRLIHAWALAKSGFQVDDTFEPRQLSQAKWLDAQKELTALEKVESTAALR